MVPRSVAVLVLASALGYGCSDGVTDPTTDTVASDGSDADAAATDGDAAATDASATATDATATDATATDASGASDASQASDASDTGQVSDASQTSDGDVVVSAACAVTVRFDGAPQATSVAVAGVWNGFSATADPMTRDGGVWVATLELPPGEHAYKIAVDGSLEANVPVGVPTHWLGGVENRNLVVRDCGRGELAARDVALTNGRVTGKVCFTPAVDGSALAALDVTLDGAALGLSPDGAGCVTLDAAVEAARGKHRLEARARDAAGRSANDDPLWVPLWSTPLDWRDATLYMAMPDRFRDSDGSASPVSGPEAIANWQGGDLAGLQQAIEEGWFEALGVSALWLTPVLRQPAGAFIGIDGVHLFAGYHGYWPVAVRDIDVRYGGEAALRSLVASAHARGIRIVMDVVLNHVHADHPYCAEGLCRTTCVCGTSGCDWEERARDCQFATYLPDLEYREHTTVERVADDVLAFVRDFDIDGLRMDAVKHVDHAIVQAIVSRLARVEAAGGAPLWLVGETFTGSDGHGQIMAWVRPGELDGQFDFPLYWSIRSAFAGGGSFRALEGALAASETAYGASLPWMSPFLGNHDVPRMATVIAGNDLGPFGGTVDRMAAGSSAPTEWDIINRQSMAFAFLLTLRGVPLIYMGDELGLAGSSDPDNRRLLPARQADLTSNQSELLRRVRELGAARQDHKVLRQGQRRELWIDDDLYVQARWLDASEVEPGGQRVAIVAMNKGGAARSEAVTIPAELGLDGRGLASIFSARLLEVSGGATRIDLAPSEYAIFMAP